MPRPSAVCPTRSPGEVAKHRQNILVERAVVTERIRLAIGLPLRDLSEYAPTDAQLEDSVIAEKYYEPPLINIISYACNACPTKQVRVTNMCQGCLAHPCMGGVPQGRHLPGAGQERHRSDQVHQVRQVCRRVPLWRHPAHRATLRGGLRHGCHRL